MQTFCVDYTRRFSISAIWRDDTGLHKGEEAYYNLNLAVPLLYQIYSPAQMCNLYSLLVPLPIRLQIVHFE